MALTKITGEGVGSLNVPSFLAKMSGDQDVTSQTKTKVQFDTEVYDTDGKYDHSTNYRFTPTVAGTYFLHAQVDAKSNNNTELRDFFLVLAKNGTDLYVTRHNLTNNFHNRMALNLQVTDVANTTDYYEVEVYVSDDSGNPTLAALEPLGGDNGVASFFGAYKLIGV
jgi:hypothetical protein|tara:strand:+ start:133 stop:633 length:501 start_codon:yes stop_codon:yes gene_type:complete